MDEEGVPQNPAKHYERWMEENAPPGSLRGKAFAVTGTTSGLGYWTVAALFRAGATVIMLNRHEEKTRRCEEKLKEGLSDSESAQVGELEFIQCDLNSFGSVRRAATTLKARYKRLDGLALNAGVMMVPFELTEDGYDVQLQTNHLSHSLLASLLFETLQQSPDARIVSHTSLAHAMGKPVINFDSINEGDADSWWLGTAKRVGMLKTVVRYGQAKLANVLFANELARRLSAHGIANVKSACVHPGYSRSDELFPYAFPSFPLIKLKKKKKPSLKTRSTALQRRAGFPGWRLANARVAQAAQDGCLPLLHALIGEGVANGDFYGPKNVVHGQPAKTSPQGHGKDTELGKRLWKKTEEIVGSAFLPCS